LRSATLLRGATAAATAALLVSATACSSSSSGSQATTPSAEITTTTVRTTTTSAAVPDPDAARWQLVADFRRHPAENPFPPASGGPKVWSLLQSDSLDRTGAYPRLPTYSRVFARGVAAWHADGGTCGGLPAIGVTASRAAKVCNTMIPQNAVFVSPNRDRLAVVGWESPITGDVVVGVGFADLDERCGRAVPYWIERGTTSLAAGEVVRSGSKTLPALRTPVTRGESIFFIVGPSAGAPAGCDATQLQVTIAPVT
jgi:hypothetical protein